MSSNVWELSKKGSNQVNLMNGDTIAWSFVVDNEQFISALPIATLTSKYPSVCFRNNLYNTGSTDSPAPKNNNLLWKFNSNSFEADSTPAVINNKVFINSWDGFFCINEKDGKKIWENLLVKGESSPAFYNSKIYVGSNDGKLYCLNEINGKNIWSSLLQPNPVFTGISSSPKVVENKVFIGTFNESGSKGAFYCLNENNGTVVWKHNTSSIHLSSPAILNDKVLIGQMGLFEQTSLSWNPPYGILCLEKNTGNLTWNFSTNGAVGSSPVIYNNKIFFTSRDGFLYCLSEEGKELWKNYIGFSVSSPAVIDYRIFVGSGTFGKEGKFYCFDINGKKLWDFVPNGGVQCSPVVAQGKVYFATNVEDGTIYCLNTSNGELIWKYLPEPKQYILCSPTIANGRLFICSDNGYLYCFENSGENIESKEETSTKGINAFFVIGIIAITTIIFFKKKKKK